jgi:signal transduction histidine kinase
MEQHMVRTRTIKVKESGQDVREGLAEKLAILENHLGQLEEQLIRSQRLAALGTMANMIAHEFNNILTPIVSYAQYAMKQDDVALMRKALEKAYENGKEAAEVCQQLLSFGRGESQGTVSDLAKVVQTTLRCLVRNPAKDNIDLHLSLAEGMTAAIEPCMLQQVLYNLILNARDAMAGKKGKLTIVAAEAGDQLKIEVTDTGPGIAPEILTKIFDPFFTTKNKPQKSQTISGGSGLGLAVSRQILDRAKGNITVASEVGKGTTFTILLPKAGG